MTDLSAFRHPASEAELQELVREANREGRQIRVRGSAHSVPGAILSDGGIDVMLDRYRGFRVVDPAIRRVEVEAGIHIGPDPHDPAGPVELPDTLLGKLHKLGWMLDATGGISHQTVSGFIATGSSGGSVRHSVNDNLHAVRIIDGRGDVQEFVRDRDPEFAAMAPNLGLLGIVSTVTFDCAPDFAVDGEESVREAADAAVDLFGPGDEQRPSLETFVRETDFARVEWWPQRGLERAVVWQATREVPPEPFTPKPYDRFTGDDELSQQIIAVLYSLLGNLHDIRRGKATLEDNFDELSRLLQQRSDTHHLGAAGRLIARVLARIAEAAVRVSFDVLGLFSNRLERGVPRIFPKLARRFLHLDSEAGGPQHFEDWAWRALPMDNALNDVVIPTAFTEAWIPLNLATRTMEAIHRHFTSAADDAEAYRRTGTFIWELYAAKPSTFWLSPSYTDGADDWADGVLRINPYWYADDAADPARTLFKGFWEFLREEGIPFRLHWGKHQPVSSPEDRRWVTALASRYEHWQAFLALREQRDPNNVFLTKYWRDRLGLWDAPEPVPDSS